jgi:hypothetical protein
MPRALTTTLKAFDFRVAHALDALGIELDAADLNVHFWSFVLRLAAEPGAEPLELVDLFPPRLNAATVEALCGAIEDFNCRFGLELTAFGLSFGSPARTADLARKTAHPGLERLADEYVASLVELLDLDDPRLVAISLGVTSANSLTFGCAFAAAVRRRLPNTRLVLGKHGYENFSLKIRADAIRENGHLGQWFDRVVFEEERLTEELASLSGRALAPLVRGDRHPGQAVSEGALRVLFERSRWLRTVSIPLARCTYLTPLSRNKCYWKKCTFCIQIEKHLADRFWEESRELELASAELAVIHDAGVGYVIFDDEAVSPANLRRLCDALEARPGSALPLKWTVRIIADPKFDRELIERMARTGCVEVLFGLETIREETARDMGKVSFQAGEAALFDLLASFTERGIGIFLNLIYAFPTESDDAFCERTLPFATRAQSTLPGVTLQFNKFGLFYGTTIDREPSRFGVNKLVPVSTADDLELVVKYEDRFGRRDDTPESETYFAASLGMNLARYRQVATRHEQAFVMTLFQLNYASFGFIHKAEAKEELLHFVLREVA